jgi:RNA polymerase primary sigma factor
MQATETRPEAREIRKPGGAVVALPAGGLRRSRHAGRIDHAGAADGRIAPEVPALPETPTAATVSPELDVFRAAARPTSTFISSAPPSEVDGLQLYLREAGKAHLLTAAEEVTLAQEIEAGLEARAALESGQVGERTTDELLDVSARGEEARQRLISANLRLVVSLAKQHLGPGIEFSDLIQEGNVGLMRAVDRFDWRRGNRFSTYALWWIRQAVSTAMSDQARPIRLPSHMMDTLSRLAKAEQRLTQELGRSATDEEVCQSMGVTITRLAELRQLRERPSSLDVPVGEDGDADLSDLVEDAVAPTPLAEVIASSLREQVCRVLTTLDPRERMVIEMRFGIEDDQPLTLEQVGKCLRITKERVRQIEARALRKLRHSTRSRWLLEYAENE